MVQAGGGQNSCTTNGVMNAVEIDVGNLTRWLDGGITGHGGNVDYQEQNGYVLYFSDRRGMLLNPNRLLILQAPRRRVATRAWKM